MSFERSHSPYINHFLSADTIVPSHANPQALNRYSYVLNNPIRYADPSGHCIWDLCIAEGIGVVELVLAASASSAGVSTIQNHDAIAKSITNAGEYISKRVTDRVKDFEMTVHLVNSGKKMPEGPCKKDVVYCIVGGVVGVGILAYAVSHGGCNEPESNSSCPPKPGPVVQETPTTTPSIPAASTSMPTNTPNQTATRTPTSTPAPVFSPFVRRHGGVFEE